MCVFTLRVDLHTRSILSNNFLSQLQNIDSEEKKLYTAAADAARKLHAGASLAVSELSRDEARRHRYGRPYPLHLQRGKRISFVSLQGKW